MRPILQAFTFLLPLATVAHAADDTWLVLPGGEGPGKGKHVVLVSGDEEYRSEEALPQLAQILSKRHGFDCTVLFAVDPETGIVDPNVLDNVPGLERLADADLMVLFTRYRALPPAQMRFIDDYLTAGKPVLGIRTATHAFNYPADSEDPYRHYGNGYAGGKAEWADGFGRLVLGEKWHSHHGQHKVQSARGRIAEGAAGHPILRGVADGAIWGPTDVYGVRLPLPGDSYPLVMGEVVHGEGAFEPDDPFYGMEESDSRPDPSKNDPMMPLAWLKTYRLPGGQRGTAFTSTIGASTDLADEEVRRLLVNATYYLTGRDVPAKADVAPVGDYRPTAYGFPDKDHWRQLGKRPEDFLSR